MIARLTCFLLYGGIALQIWNIYVYSAFLHRSSNDVLTTRADRSRILSRAAQLLLVFFLPGYLFVAFSRRSTIAVGCIFFFGALFCSIMIRLVIQLTSTVKRRSIGIVRTLIKVVDERDANLNGHSLYVLNLTITIWRHLPDQMRATIKEVDLSYAALLHDIGKMGIPERILNKPGKLSDEEWELMRQHPKKGVEILQELPSFEAILPWIEYHHERVDGHGYYGLKGEEIPLASRIISLADTYSVITMRRVYKSPQPYEEAARILREAAGTQLDAQLVEVFLTIPREELAQCVPESVEVFRENTAG